jgi:hypothetical protein
MPLSEITCSLDVCIIHLKLVSQVNHHAVCFSSLTFVYYHFFSNRKKPLSSISCLSVYFYGLFEGKKQNIAVLHFVLSYELSGNLSYLDRSFSISSGIH